MTSVGSLSLKAYAEICAELAASGRTRAEVLAAHELTDEEWMNIDAVYTRAIATDAMGDGRGASVDFAEAYARAVDALPLPELSLDEWRALRDDVERRGARALVERRIASATFVRLSRRWA